MLHEVHGRLFRYQHIPDPLAAVADRLMRDMRVLCLDEFFVTDVADATILARLFGYLWDRGLVLVATSNRRAGPAPRAAARGLWKSRWGVGEGGARTPSVASMRGSDAEEYHLWGQTVGAGVSENAIRGQQSWVRTPRAPA